MKGRLLEFIEYKEYSIRNFEREISTSNGTIARFLSKDTDMQCGILSKISENFPELNLDWLITGRGQMLFSQKNDHPKPPAPDPSIQALNAIINEKDARIADLQSIIDRLLAQRSPAAPPAPHSPSINHTLSTPPSAPKATQNHFATIAEPEETK